VQRGIALLVFVLEAARIFSGITHAAFVRRRGRRIGNSFVGHAKNLPETFARREPAKNLV